MTPEQIVTLRAACFADPTAAAFFPPRDNVGLCTYLNQNSAFIVWRSTTSAPDIMDAINWANFTPSDVPTGDAAAPAAMTNSGDNIKLTPTLGAN